MMVRPSSLPAGTGSGHWLAAWTIQRPLHVDADRRLSTASRPPIDLPKEDAR